MKKKTACCKKIVLLIITVAAMTICFGASGVYAADIPAAETETETGADASFDLGDELDNLIASDNIADTVKIIVLLTVIALAPSILILMTGFTRILIVLSFVRNALGLQQTPPNQVLIGLALFLTFFLMSPIFSRVYDTALVPYMNGEITQEDALDNTVAPFRSFMINQTTRDDLLTFIRITDTPPAEEYDDIKLEVIIPAFIISELKRAFLIGFFIYIPFLIIDLVVASTLMSLGMMMLPPAMVSMPFKLILFLIVDGWGLIITALLASFN